MRHANDLDLDQLEDLLERLRQIPELRERKRGAFSKRSRGFLHFHADASDFYADVRLTDTYERLPVTTAEERAHLLALVRESVR